MGRCSVFFFHALTSEIYRLLYLLLRLKLLGNLGNSTGKRITIVVWKFFLTVVLKIRGKHNGWKKKDNTVCSLFVEIARHQKVVRVGSSSRVWYLLEVLGKGWIGYTVVMRQYSSQFTCRVLKIFWKKVCLSFVTDAF